MADRPRQPDGSEPPVRRRRPTVTDAPADEVLVTDLRQAGWSWGWDTLAREFAGILHQSGVGLYFTYATYTDNRKESPYRGSSYTGVEALSDFSGESADDIRTINKLLATLGLARFETYTVYIPSKDGRRATRNRLHCYLTDRDPHLTRDDVLAVLRLALKDEKVYKYIRHIFRSGFRPIDRIADATGAPREHPNPWYAILLAIQRTVEWRTLGLRAERDHLALRERNSHGVEAAAHRRRRDNSEPSTILQKREAGDATCLPLLEDGGMVGDSEDGVVSTLPGTEDDEEGILPGTDGKHDQDPAKQTETSSTITKTGTTTTTTRAPVSLLPKNAQSDADWGEKAEMEAVFALFGQANRREVTPVERDLLRQIIDDFDGPARQHLPDHSGAVWVTAAIIEAVDAGSHFVSPRRVRLICQRWVKDGFQAARAPASESKRASAQPPPLDIPDVSMPNGQSSRTVWRRIIGIARGSVSADVLIRFLEPCHIASYDEWRREITIAVPDERTEEKLERTYRQMIERALAMIFGRTMRFQCVVLAAPGGSEVRPVADDLAGEEVAVEAPAEHADQTASTDVDEGGFEVADQRDESGKEEATSELAEGESSPLTGAAAKGLGEGAPTCGEMESPRSVSTDRAETNLESGDINQQLWARALDCCQADVSALRRQLFETHATLAGREGRDLVVVAANTFIADQLALCTLQLEAALRTVFAEDDLRLRCTIRRIEPED